MKNPRFYRGFLSFWKYIALLSKISLCALEGLMEDAQGVLKIGIRQGRRRGLPLRSSRLWRFCGRAGEHRLVGRGGEGHGALLGLLGTLKARGDDRNAQLVLKQGIEGGAPDDVRVGMALLHNDVGGEINIVKRYVG